MLREYVCALGLVALIGTGSDVRSIRRALEDRYHHARTLKANFFESSSDGHGGITAESGIVYFSRPGRMRWEYDSPQQKLFLVDGSNAWFYVPADQTASRAKMKESSDWRTPLALLVGKADLSDLCRKLDIVGPGTPGGDPEKPLTPGDFLLRCIPRESPAENSADSGAGITYVFLEVDPQARLVRVVIREPGNLETEFRFGNWEENIAISEAKFHFQPPPGVAIVDEESLARDIN